MPSLDLPNLAAYRYQAQNTPPPIGIPSTGTPIGPTSPQQRAAQTQTLLAPAATQPACPCPPGLNLSIAQGATLSSQITLVVKDASGNTQPVDITGNKFEFTAKTNPNLPDTDPSVVKVDWTETTTPKQGITWLSLPATVTATMQLVAYFYQVWMVQSPSSQVPIVTPLFSGTLVVTQPISSRH